MTELLTTIDSVVWGPAMIALLLGTHIYLTFRTGFIQRKLPQAIRMSVRRDPSGKGDISSFGALATALAATIGTGSIVGVATALLAGGPGAIFWMWIAAFFGMATIFAEAVLAQVYKEKMPDGSVVGGPAYYISRGLKSNGLAVFFSVAIIMALGFIGNMVQSNSIADAFNNAFGVNRLLIGVIVAAIGGFVFFGGMGRIASITEKIVPIMAAGYLLGGLYILVTHASPIIPAFGMVFEGAFNPAAATGGLIGATMKEAIRYGVARGLFSNEAGMGSTPHAHAVAKVKDPAEQGFVAIMGVFVDTFLVLNMTAFVIFVTGAIDGKTSGIALTQSAFSTGLGSFGLPFVAICMFFFAFSTIVGWYFFGEQNVKFLFGNKGLTPYRIVVMAFVVLGATLKLDLVWELADFFNGIMVFPNLIALIGLSKVVSEALNHFDDQGRLKANTK